MVILDTDEIKGLLKNAVISVRKNPPIKRRDDVSYSRVVKAGYEEILKLREDGYSYDVICEVFRETNRRGKKLKTAIPKNPGAAQKAAPAVKTDSPSNRIAPKPKGECCFDNDICRTLPVVAMVLGDEIISWPTLSPKDNEASEKE
jgi:hypothetical protein